MKLKTLFTIFSIILLFSQCDDNTNSVGGSIIPPTDKIEIDTVTYKVKTKSLLANDSILANSSSVYLGRHTDPESNAIFTSDFITQFNCVENYGFPEEGVIGNIATKIELKLFYKNYFGDSLNSMMCDVHQLTETLQEGKPYYTNIDPTTFYDNTQPPIAKKTYCAVDFAIPDSVRYADGYTPSITIPLPTSLGTYFIKKYYEVDANGDSIGKKNFSNSEDFINNVFKGLYVKGSQGDGTVIYVNIARLNVHFDYYIEGSSGEMDSITNGIATFSSTKEVLQVNRFKNGDLRELVEDNSCTYLKTPAGIFTEIELPITEIINNSDTLNSVKLSLTKYNKTVSHTYNYTTPQTLLLVRKSEMYKFFIKNKISNNITSYNTQFNSTYNLYDFKNIARLVNHCATERDNGLESDPMWESKNPDWNKIVLIPVTTTKDSKGNIVAMSHDLKMNSIRLKGGNDKIDLRIISSKFKNE